jgi:hypothetical protein
LEQLLLEISNQATEVLEMANRDDITNVMKSHVRGDALGLSATPSFVIKGRYSRLSGPQSDRVSDLCLAVHPSLRIVRSQFPRQDNEPSDRFATHRKGCESDIRN